MHLLGVAAMIFVAFLIAPQLVRAGFAIAFFLILIVIVIFVLAMIPKGPGPAPVVSRPQSAAPSTNDTTWWGEPITNVTPRSP
jgi:hypothetical protein